MGIQRQVVQVPRIRTVEEVVVQRVEQVQVVPRQVDKLTVVQRVRNRRVQQPVRTIEVVQENVVERIVERKKPIIQEQIVPVTRQVDQVIEVPQVQVVERVQQVEVLRTVQRTVEVPQI